jgi:hypothetical protein
MAETIEQFISNNFLLIFFAIVVFIMMYKPKFLTEFFEPDVCSMCATILPSCDPANPSLKCKKCQEKCPPEGTAE